MRFLTFVKRSFFVRVLLFMIAVMLIPLLILAGSTQKEADAAIRKQVNRINDQVVRQIMERIETTMSQIQTVGNQYGSTPSVLAALTSTGSLSNDAIRINDASATLDIAASLLRSNNDLALYSLWNDQLITTSRNVEYDNKLLYHDTAKSFLRSHTSWIYQDSDENHVYYQRRIPFDTWLEPKGSLLISIKKDLFHQLIEKVEKDNKGFFTIATSHGAVLASTRQGSTSEIAAQTALVLSAWGARNKPPQFQFHESLYSVQQSSDYDATLLISEIPQNALTEDTDRIRQYVRYLVLLLGVIGFIFVLGFAYYLYRPLYAVRRHIDRIKLGDFRAVTTIRTSNEIGELSHVLNTMSSRLQTLVEELKETADLKRRTEIKALQSQINPHFLYNSLNTILMFAHLGENGKIKSLMGSLISLLRYSMENFEGLVPLSKEIEYIRDYMHMLELRYERPLTLHIEIEESLMDMPTPKLLLQPLVENALFHGVLPLKHIVGLLRIRVYVTPNREAVILEVSDNGKGMDEARVNQLRLLLASEQGIENIGLRNVWERIGLVYGHPSSYHIESSLGEGTLFRFQFPYKT